MMWRSYGNETFTKNSSMILEEVELVTTVKGRIKKCYLYFLDIFLEWKTTFYRSLQCNGRSRDSADGIATGYGIHSSSAGKVKNFLSSTTSKPALGSTQPPIQWVLGVKRPGREADHSPPTSAEVKKIWIYTSTPPYAFMA
jgi:hypothetical protein